MAGRRAGKTYYIGRRFADMCAEYDDGEGLYIGLTAKNAWEQMYPHIMRALDDAGIQYEPNAAKMQIHHGASGIIRFCGNDSKDEREKMRGYGLNRRLAIIDECQSQKDLKYLVTEILELTLIDCNGTLELYGSAPRVRGTWWENEISRESNALRKQWNMFDNTYLIEPMKQLEKIIEERGWKISDPIVQREYFGRIIYDDEALVFKVKEANYFDDAALKAWHERYAATVRAIIGLDIGYEDADAIAVLLYSANDSTIWIVHEKTVRRQLIADTVAMAQEAVAIAKKYTNEAVYIMADFGGGGKKIAEDMYYVHKLPILPAEKQSKEAEVENLQAGISTARVKIRKGGAMDLDCMKVVYMRDEMDRIIRTIDETVHHSDIIDAVLYAHREAIKHAGKQ